MRHPTELGLNLVIYHQEIADLWDFVSSTFNSKSAIKPVDITAISLGMTFGIIQQMGVR